MDRTALQWVMNHRSMLMGRVSLLQNFVLGLRRFVLMLMESTIHGQRIRIVSRKLKVMPDFRGGQGVMLDFRGRGMWIFKKLLWWGWTL